MRRAKVAAAGLVALLLWGCAATAPHPLLREDPLRMSDVGLARYYYDLGEAIDRCEGRTGSSPSVSVGGGASTGGWSGVGIGVGLGREVAPACESSELRRRRVDTLMELKRRGISP